MSKIIKYIIAILLIITGIILISVGEIEGKSKYNDLSKSLNMELINTFVDFESKKNDILMMSPDKKKYDDAQLYSILTIIGIVLLILGVLLLIYVFIKNKRKNANDDETVLGVVVEDGEAVLGEFIENTEEVVGEVVESVSSYFEKIINYLKSLIKFR